MILAFLAAWEVGLLMILLGLGIGYAMTRIPAEKFSRRPAWVGGGRMTVWAAVALMVVGFVLVLNHFVILY
jgi:hypothetical protein